MLVILGAITVVLGYGAFVQGAVAAQDTSLMAAAIGIVSAGCFLALGRHSTPPKNRRTLAIVALTLVVPFFQIVPLTPLLLKKLSPYRGEVAAAIDPRAWAPLTAVPSITLHWIIRLSAALLLLIVARELTWQRRNRPWILFFPVLVVAGAEAVLGCCQFLGSSTHNAARGTYVNRDHFSALLELAIPASVILAVAAYRQGKSRFQSSAYSAILACGLLGLATVMILAVVFSLSRMGFCCALASLFVAGAFNATATLSNRMGSLLKLVPAITVAVLVSLAFIWLPSNALIQRFALLGSGELNADSRLQIWQQTIPLIKASPWFGLGLGSYESVFLHFKKVAPMWTVSHAHNDYLEVFSETGLFGLLPLLFLAGYAIVSAVKAAWLPVSMPQHYLGVGCLGAFSATLLHSLVDFSLYIPENAFVLAWICGIALGSGHPLPGAFAHSIGSATRSNA